MKKPKFNKYDIILLILLIIAAALELGRFTFVPGDEVMNNIVFMILSRLVASVFFFILIKSNNVKVFETKNKKNFALVLPCVLIAIFNMPFAELLRGDCTVSAGPGKILLFALECLLVGAFEELAFRGLLLPIVLRKYSQSKIKILLCVIITSCVFGLYHLVNLFMGAGIGPTLLQVCYSALVGAMCGAIVLITGNVVPCILIHGIYNFCGMLVDTFGSGSQWNVTRVIAFAAVSVLVLVYMVIVFIKKESFPLIENNKV